MSSFPAFLKSVHTRRKVRKTYPEAREKGKDICPPCKIQAGEKITWLSVPSKCSGTTDLSGRERVGYPPRFERGQVLAQLQAVEIIPHKGEPRQAQPRSRAVLLGPAPELTGDANGVSMTVGNLLC
jgi:hypothetical protein